LQSPAFRAAIASVKRVKLRREACAEDVIHDRALQVAQLAAIPSRYGIGSGFGFGLSITLLA
jgi:hypothetical protein